MRTRPRFYVGRARNEDTWWIVDGYHDSSLGWRQVGPFPTWRAALDEVCRLLRRGAQ